MGSIPEHSCHVRGQAIACSESSHPVPFKLPDRSRLLASDMFTCVDSGSDVTCWGANRDGWFGKPSKCPAHLRLQWPTTHGFELAPNVACSTKPVTVLDFKGRRSDMSIGPRGACAIIDHHVRCIGAIPTPSIEVTTVTVSSGTRANACGLSDSRLVCWGDGYSPPGRPAIAVAIPLVSEYPNAAVVDFTAPTGTTWPSPYAIHRDCKLPVQVIPKCAAGVTGESWSSIAPYASSLVGQQVRVRDRLSVGPQESNNGYWAACSSLRVDPAS